MKVELLTTGAVILVAAAIVVPAMFFAGARQRAHEVWVQEMRAAECKRTGYAGLGLVPIWTCPDGQVYLESYR